MRKIRIAHLTCGSEYSGVEKEIEEAAHQVNAQIVYPEVDIGSIKETADKFGLQVASPDLRLMIARAKSIVSGDTKADAVFITILLQVRRRRHRAQRHAELYPATGAHPCHQLFIYRAYHPRYASDETGSPIDHSAEAQPAGERRAGRADRRHRLWLEHHQGRRHAG